MSDQHSFTVVNDAVVCAAIAETSQRLIYVAPGISKPVVEAIGRSLQTNRDLHVTAIVDLDSEVYRLGYGTEEGLRALQALIKEQGFELRQQPGLRIGLLVTDQKTLVYSPTPLLIEAGSSNDEKPNAVVLTRDSASTEALLFACGVAGAKGMLTPTLKDAELGAQPATPHQVNESLESLRETPPKRFDIARIERVFESKIQFVELEVTRYKLSTKRLKIPNDLLVGDDRVLKKGLLNSFKLLQDNQEIVVEIRERSPDTAEPIGSATIRWSETELELNRKKLHDDFLISVPKFGAVIMRRNRARFDMRVDLLTAQIQDYANAVRDKLEGRISEAVKSLAAALLPRVRGAIPLRYLKLLSMEPSDADLCSMLEQDIRDSLGTDTDVFDPEVRCVFKDITYESIRDLTFRDALSKALRDAGGERLVAQLFSEHDAAPET